MNLITERELLHTVTEIFEVIGYRVFHVSDSRKEIRAGDEYRLVGDTQATGYPDLTIAGHDEAIWAELKSWKGKLDQEQMEWLDALPPHRAYVWQSEDLDLVIEIASFGHPADGRTCWTCSREAIIERMGVRRRRKRGTGNPGPGRGGRRQ